ncbi:MAG: hypothetical protein JWO36_3746 [Myxococcales bacterium]|nr:hypothetical protein [Myxococcales bacterium]
MTDQDDKTLAEISQQLAAIDLDDASAQRIARRARQGVGRGPSPLRFLEPILVAIFATSFLVWVLYKIYEVFG